MKKRLSRFLAFMLVLCMVMTMVPAAFADSNEVQILFLDTSDVHGQQFATDYTQDADKSGTHYQAMTRVATYVKQQRAEYKNVFLSDSGDTIQGTPLTYYYAFYQKDAQDPAMKVMRMMDYDMWVVGNHEFNYGMDILQRQLDYLTSASTETESQVGVSMANYLDASTNNDTSRDWKTWNGYAPYVIKEYDGVKVAVMGIGNPNIANWDVPENWKGIYFAGVVETYKHYEAEMKAQADLIVLVSHSGIEVMSINLLLDDETDPVIWRGPVIGGVVTQFWTDVLWDVDYLLVDMPPGTGDVTLSVFQSIPLSGIVVVASPQELVGMVVEKAVKMAEKMAVPIVGLVENMSYLVCPDCGRKIYLFGEGRSAEAAKKHGIPLLTQMPIDPQLAALTDEGRIEEFKGDWLADAVTALEAR